MSRTGIEPTDPTTRALPILEITAGEWRSFLATPEPPASDRVGGRTWWAHFEFTRINIGPIILRKKVEDLREAGASSGEASGP